MDTRRTRASLVIVMALAPLAAAALVLSLLSGLDRGGLQWWAFGLFTVGVLAGLWYELRGPSAIAGIALVAGAAGCAGWDLWATPDNGREARFLGEGVPSGLAATTWLLLVVCVVGAVAALLRPGTAVVTVRLLVVATLLAGLIGTGAALGGQALSEARAEAVSATGIDHTVDPAADTKAVGPMGTWPPPAGPASWSKAWNLSPDAAGVTTIGVPGMDLAVSLVTRERNGEGSRSGVIVHDLRTGAQRWHFFLDTSAPSGVAVSPSTGRLLLVLWSTAVLFDLDGGAEIRRFALPKPSIPGVIDGFDYRVLTGDPDPIDPLDRDPQVEIVGDTTFLASVSATGTTDVSTVAMRTGLVTPVVSGVPSSCRFRALRAIHGPNVAWVVRDGVGCGPATITGFLSWVPTGVVQVPFAGGCDVGCEVLDVFATEREIVVQTDTELLTFVMQAVHGPRSRTPIDPDSRAVAEPGEPADGYIDTVRVPSASDPRTNTVVAGDVWYQFRQNGKATGQVFRVNPATGETGPPSEDLPCGRPTKISAAGGVLIVSCGGERPSTVAFG
jgi:hypothetical protein